eukprot:GDKJ01028133.1.p1 GENE.GDKJ01028133.1~~GDKJ01028133.1.p1  ORF type:complete len:499 (-),score=74.44 GDKJ01028133.1:64-1560(-)
MKSIQIVDGEERVCANADIDLCNLFGIQQDTPVKVISIFGNTGAGKSRLLNKIFFPDSRSDVFPETSRPQGGPPGVYAAVWKDPQNVHDTALVLDTEGIMGVLNTVENFSLKSRLLLKILAISDVVIFRKWGERLTSDVFQFIDESSDVFRDFFREEIVQLSTTLDLPAQSFGASVIISHETVHSDLLDPESFIDSDSIVVDNNSVTESSQIEVSYSVLDAQAFMKVFNRGYRNLIRSQDDESPVFSSFSSVEYFGVRSGGRLHSDLTPLRNKIFSKLRKDSSLRIARPFCIVIAILQRLTILFCRDDPKDESVSARRRQFRLLPHDAFRCQAKCKGCDASCTLAMNHWNRPHCPSSSCVASSHNEEEVQMKEMKVECVYRAQLKNRKIICRSCFEGRKEFRVLKRKMFPSKPSAKDILKSTISGDLLECESCGVVWTERDSWLQKTASPVRYGAGMHVLEHVWDDEKEDVGNCITKGTSLSGGCTHNPFAALGFVFN